MNPRFSDYTDEELIELTHNWASLTHMEHTDLLYLAEELGRRLVHAIA